MSCKMLIVMVSMCLAVALGGCQSLPSELVTIGAKIAKNEAAATSITATSISSDQSDGTLTVESISTPAPTPTSPNSLTDEEETYLERMFALEERKEAGVVSISMMIDALNEIQPPLPLAERHSELQQATESLSSATAQFLDATLAYLMAISTTYCDPFSYNYSSCLLQMDLAELNYQAAVDASDAAFATFDQVWADGVAEWNQIYINHDLDPVPTATPFPLPPVETPQALATPDTGVFGTEITVTDVVWDAYKQLSAADEDVEPADAGHQYVLVKVKVRNKGTEAILVNPSQFSIYADSTQYEEADKVTGDDLRNETIIPEHEVDGSLAFEIPNILEGNALLLYLDGDLVFDIGKKNVDMPQETATPVPTSTPIPSPTSTSTPAPTSTPIPSPTSTSTATETATNTPSPTPEVQAEVIVPALNVRAGPGTNHAIETVAQQGEMLDVLGQFVDCAWLHVTTADDVTGWVSGGGQYVSLTAACDAIPAVDENGQ